MFGFGKRKSSEPAKPDRGRRSSDGRERRSQNMAQLGFLAGVGDDGDVDLLGNLDVGDDDLEEELAMLLDGKETAIRRPKTSPPKKPTRSAQPGRKSAGSVQNFDVDINDDDEDEGDVDLDDPELEAELGDILGIPTASGNARVNAAMENDEEDDEQPPPAAPTMTKEQLIKLLQERLDLYEKAKAAADTVNDSAKSRRFTRGVKTLKEMLSKVKNGRVIDESDIPPAVSIGVIKKDNVPDTPTNSSPFVPPTREETSEPKVPERNAVVEKPPRHSPMQITLDNEETNLRLPEPLAPTPAFIQPQMPANPESLPVNPPDSSSVEEQKLSISPIDPVIETRLKEYKRTAVGLKRQGDVSGAVKYLKLSKALESALKNGEIININDYPAVESAPSEAPVLSEASSTEPPPLPPKPSEAIVTPVSTAIPEPESAPAAAAALPGDDIFGAPPAPTTIMEALEQRLQKYKSEVEKASAASNSSKARRMGRIVKQYEEAIVMYKKGKPVQYDELPTPPGFAPIPVGGIAKPGLPAELPQLPSSPAAALHPQPSSSTPSSAMGSPEKKPKADTPVPGPSPASGQSPSGSTGSTVSRAGKPSTKLTLQEKQLQIICLRQQQFKDAALNAKKRGDINQAREFLRTAKGFDKLIQVAQGGLPVDMATLPSPPEAVLKLELEEADNFEVVSASDCIMPPGNAAEVFSKLEDDLKQQLKMCMKTREHFKSIGDVASANRFESMALESKRDLDTLRLAMKKNSDIPKYHYENRIFSITECNTDIGDEEIEITIVQGLNYKVSNPSDVDTYVKIELPYPSAEEVQTNKTPVVRDTNSPTYDATFKMNINRTARNFQRFVHRHGFKCEIWSKG
ncbi:unnamed protein product [Orchesella dallaii]|uniref:DM14 domain-containing protein n=1 Tax=Orchesella dallaii TaxID=48710 RepID=A0ABP1QIZ4_9HEXA